MGKHTTYTQTQEQTLAQTLSPQQLLAVQLLELTTVEIEDRVRSEIMDNPALEPVEHDEEGDVGKSSEELLEALSMDSDDDYSGNEDIQPVSGGGYWNDIPVGDTLSFGDTLMEQLGECVLTPVERAVGEYIIGSLDEDGLLRKSLQEIEDELLVYNGVDANEDIIISVLSKIQSFEPAGIAARDLQECLLLQLARMDSGKDVALCKEIVSNHYDDFAGKRWDQIADKIGIGKEECRDAIADIIRLNPRPGASLSENVGFSRQQIVPDFLLDVSDDMVSVALNNAHVPSLKVSDSYMQMLEEHASSGEQKDAALFLKQKIDLARGFITAVQQREQTMLSTMRAIASKQKEFFLSGGDEAFLKPMILEDIAKMTGYDISTISRVGNSKYVQVPWGIYQLKYFFSDGVVKDDGSKQSVYELFRILRELVDNEDKTSPLTDLSLQEELASMGYSIARRTVAKYREQLGIPVARLRKE
ncbi:MAG: RNA polymerase factor sigma-54 [Bacteroidaceae bacterium]|nr:RNA polymerase factor sigma-54 [Bacteroidaceae bacterium]